MAIVFELWAECSNESDRRELVKYFDGVSCTLLTGKRLTWKATPAAWLPTAMYVTTDNLSLHGRRDLQDVLETTECGLRFYHHLMNGPAFRFARVAWEAQNVPLSDLHECVTSTIPGKCRLDLECAMHDSLYKELGSPEFCFPFRPGYWWTRYFGERYLPLFSSDQEDLNELCGSLLPEYFRY